MSNCRERKSKQFSSRPQTKRWKLENLLPEVRRLVLEVPSGISFTKEAIAINLRAKTHLVEQCLHQLNLEGLVSQPEHRAPHDSPRNPYSSGSNSVWLPNLYYRRGNKEPATAT